MIAYFALFFKKNMPENAAFKACHIWLCMLPCGCEIFPASRGHWRHSSAERVCAGTAVAAGSCSRSPAQRGRSRRAGRSRCRRAGGERPCSLHRPECPRTGAGSYSTPAAGAGCTRRHKRCAERPRTAAGPALTPAAGDRSSGACAPRSSSSAGGPRHHTALTGADSRSHSHAAKPGRRAGKRN